MVTFWYNESYGRNTLRKCFYHTILPNFLVFLGLCAALGANKHQRTFNAYHLEVLIIIKFGIYTDDRYPPLTGVHGKHVGVVENRFYDLCLAILKDLKFVDHIFCFDANVGVLFVDFLLVISYRCEYVDSLFSKPPKTPITHVSLSFCELGLP